MLKGEYIGEDYRGYKGGYRSSDHSPYLGSVFMETTKQPQQEVLSDIRLAVIVFCAHYFSVSEYGPTYSKRVHPDV